MVDAPIRTAEEAIEAAATLIETQQINNGAGKKSLMRPAETKLPSN